MIAKIDSKYVNAFLSALLEQQSCGVLLTDPDGQILVASPRLFAVLGETLSAATSVEGLLVACRSGTDPEGKSAVLRALVTDAAGARDMAFSGPFGTCVVRVRHVQIADDGGAIVAHLGLLDDVTAQQSHDAYLKKVIAITCHDLRNPLAAISMNTTVLTRPTSLTDDRRINSANRISSSVARMIGIVDALDRWSEPEPATVATYSDVPAE